MNDAQVMQLVEAAVEEDVGEGDVTAFYFVDAGAVATARVVAREAGVMAGADVAAAVFRRIDPEVRCEGELGDGVSFAPGDELMRVSGRARSVLTGERTALNFLQRMCGVATLTRRYVEAVRPHTVKVLDTRKTTPGWRVLEKRAVRAGGGTNHRMGLYDMVMVKDNHLLAEGAEEGLREAIGRVKAERPGMLVELEADTLGQVGRFLAMGGVDRILLDNMGCEEMREAVALAAGSGVELEASGGITLETVGAVAATGVDAISVGALTHSARALDLGLDF